MKAKTKKICILLMCTLMTLMITACGNSSSQTEDQKPEEEQDVQEENRIMDPKLISKVTKYFYHADTKEWEEQYGCTYVYENGYPVTADETEYGEPGRSLSFEYVFENNVPVSRKDYINGEFTQDVEYNNGRVYQISFKDPEAGRRNLKQFAYSDDGEYFTSVFHSNVYGEGSEEAYHMEEADSIQVSSEDGLLLKTINSGFYANWNREEEKEWLRFNGTYTAEYDNGIVAQTSAVFRTGPSGITDKFEIVYEDGKVSEVTVYTPDAEGNFVMFQKVCFEYTDESMELSRYTRMINALILGNESTYYIYNWY